MVVTGSRQA
ncbi:hypothetical protein D043_3609A, partial [Vibrio parahaemolyticus EKP-021]